MATAALTKESISLVALLQCQRLIIVAGSKTTYMALESHIQLFRQRKKETKPNMDF